MSVLYFYTCITPVSRVRMLKCPVHIEIEENITTGGGL